MAIKKKKKRRRYKKKEIVIEGRTFVVQGYEPFFLNDLPKFGIQLDDVVEVPVIPYFFKKKMRGYHPDFYIRSTNTVVEIKSSWTMKKNKKKNEAKWNSVVARGYRLWIIVYDASGKILDHTIRRDSDLL